MKKLILLISILSIMSGYTDAQLLTYKAPKGSTLSTDFTVSVRQKGQAWHPVAIYLANVANVPGTVSIIENTSFAYFDFKGEVEVAVTANKKSVKNIRVRPLSYGIAPKISGNTLTFNLTQPRNLSLEINGDIFHNLQLFANAIETYKPLQTDTNIIYYGPGIHQVGTLIVPSHKTVYIAGGAIVQGQFLINKVENVRILGHGILTQFGAPEGTINTLTAGSSKESRPIQSRNDELTINFSKNVEVDGPIILPHKYGVLIGQSHEVKINNIKSFSSEGNADGLDIFCSTDVTINNIFMRNADDCIAIYGHRWEFYGNTKDISVSNAILWADVAHPILMGTHGDPPHPDTLSNMRFNNIDILDQHENQLDYQGCMALNAGDANLINNIVFDNIRIEDIRKGQLFNLRVMYNHKYNTAPGHGVENIYFKNVSYKGTHANMSVIAGYDEQRLIKNITFENLIINGTVITDTMPDKPVFYKTGDMSNIFIGENVENVKFIPLQK
ncbi:glycosyl hydrolase family 28 protein [Mucilaginibacter sp. X5P1]|uniref:glycosyl hydrolase family 28 protein n=1 Tax=Mucilaginibacter sp. X5P1 TaxID=2723088 RepID=UPI0016135B72|nr:glycosyl hydrolase family 28 protein [Mucilaginibacter sp. X5P1]MBB6141946.1 hypothetical protein [Mucilaginibacter sp. X5P1]